MQRVLSPILIGRERELSILEDALLGANRGQGQVVVLSGDAGMGKTRLSTELQRRAQQLGMTALWGGCSEAELTLPYLPFLEAIGNYLASADLAEIRRRLGPIRRELAHLFPQLDPDASRSDDDTTQGKPRLFEAILALLAIPAETNGLLLVIEDLHWADASTRELLDYLTRRLRSARILVVGTYRGDEMHRKHPLLPMVQSWRRSSMATIVELDPLSSDAVARIVRAIFDIEDVSDDTRDFLHQRSEGNPFVLEEVLKAALDRGDIFRDHGGWTRKSLSDIRLPDSVRNTILMRVERLTDREQGVLRSAAVLGNSFSYPAVVAVAGGDELAVQTAIATCVQQQLLEDDPHVQGRYRFHHALTREAIYEDIIVPVRERLHSLAADHLAAVAAPAADQANQLLAAGRIGEAVPACLRAADEAIAQYAYADAAALLKLALPHVNEGRPHVLCRLAEALWLDADPAQARNYLQEAVPALEADGNRAEAAHYRLLLGRTMWETGRPDLALAEYERVRRELEPLGPSEDLAMAHVRLAGMRLFQFDGEGTIRHAEESIRISEAAGAPMPRIWGMQFLGGGLCMVGRYDEGIDLVDQSYEEAMARGLYTVARNSAFNGAMDRLQALRIHEIPARLALLRQVPGTSANEIGVNVIEAALAEFAGRMESALEAYEHDRAVARDTGSETFGKRLDLAVGRCLTELDRLDEAERRMPEVADFQEAQERFLTGFDRMRLAIVTGKPESALAIAGLAFGSDFKAPQRADYASASAEVFLAVGDLASARRAAEISLNERTTPFGLAMRPALVGQMALADNGDAAAAIAPLRTAIELLRSRGVESLASRHTQVLADLLVAVGDVEGAIAELREVVADGERLGMPLEARLARERLARLGATSVPEATTTAASAEVRPATGERLVTVLFADVRGYSALSRSAVPAEMAEKIGTFQRWAADEIGHHRGLVDKFAGDAVMATFNVSGASVDHAQHAVQCAISLRDKAAMLGLPLTIGIATGPAIVGALTPNANVSVVGETTNLASRLQGAGEAGEILLSGEAHRRVTGWLGRQSLTSSPIELAVKGFDGPVVAHRLIRPD
jgi:class 3 adenylate cyclase